jgi:hypothetical protein
VYLELENKVIKEDLARIRRNPGDCPFSACDNSCVVARPETAATNGGCRCDERKLRSAVQWLWLKVRFLTESMRLMRGYYTLCPHSYGDDFKVCELYAGHAGPHGTMHNILESHEKCHKDIRTLLTGLHSVDDILRKFPVTKERAEDFFNTYLKVEHEDRS